jgi:putative flippase GtrA
VVPQKPLQQCGGFFYLIIMLSIVFKIKEVIFATHYEKYYFMITIIKFIKFLAVGLSGMILDFSITYICKERLMFNKYLSNSLGFGVAAVSNFCLNRHFTYQSNNPEVTTEFYWFMAISLVSLFIYNGIVWIGINKLNINFYPSKMLAIFFITFWNFFAHLLITFQH